MAYVDGFVVPVPRARTADYEAMALVAGRVWMEHGALQFRECRGDDVKPGEVTSFPRAVALKDDEVAYFSWIVFASRADRDAINAKVMADPRLADMMDPATVPFDVTRLIYGGFELAVDL